MPLSRLPRVFRIPRAVLVSALALLAVSGGAVAAAAPFPPPTDYRQVSSPVVRVAPGATVQASVDCPDGSRLLGGGVLASVGGLAQTVNASYPEFGRSTWTASVSNAAASGGAFRVYATCAAGIVFPMVEVGPDVTVPAHSQVTARWNCSGGSAAFGGGAAIRAGGDGVTLASSLPVGRRSWQVRVNNAADTDATVEVHVSCGRFLRGYTQVSGAATVVAPGTQGSATVACPEGTVVFGGGGLSTSSSPLVATNSSVPTSSTVWQVTENNASAAPTTLTAYATCATVTGG